jgi:hypothetical protein
MILLEPIRIRPFDPKGMREHSKFRPLSIREGGAVRTRMPKVQIRFEGYLIRETAGCLLGTPPLQNPDEVRTYAEYRHL